MAQVARLIGADAHRAEGAPSYEGATSYESKD